MNSTFTPDNLRKIYISNFALSKVTGIDSIQPRHFAKNQSKDINTIVTKVFFEEYEFTRYKEKLISKGANKYPRQIAIPTLRDRIALKALNNYLQKKLSDHLNIQVPQQATRDVKSALKTGKFETVIKIDIKDFYPTISHQILEEKLKTLGIENTAITLIRNAISTGFEKDKKNIIGIPQGLSISNILAEIYMNEIDEKISKYNIFYKRYVDDVLIFCKKNEDTNIYSHFIKEVNALKLKTHEVSDNSDKTIMQPINDEFSYLGYIYNPKMDDSKKTIPIKSSSKITTSIRHSSRKKFQDAIAALFTSYSNAGKQRSKALLFWKLNLRITGCIANKKCKGWLFFFSEIDDMLMLFNLDNMIKKLCIRHHVEYKGVKKLTRAIHEIKHNKWNNNYFPNFDTYNYKNMKEVISYDKGIPVHKLKLSEQDIENKFWNIINREVKSMETDISSFS
ncbi:reverse transcriptase/maturase family protein [Photobacterium toruni]|uniref:Reverse transcriptase (RNA-dependent DNA polymerase) n=1 Tax=Photobacterium toruni TaxID=1935446 RepID=A0A1T4PV75_9GAMM|nr:reverse transcriptase/maturase family protein [Photobacterium toruni]SJZ95450.1 Reverse transcriptase (RNA-dependent DNA polymerase) [Photobacterium toruni]